MFQGSRKFVVIEVAEIRRGKEPEVSIFANFGINNINSVLHFLNNVEPVPLFDFLSFAWSVQEDLISTTKI